MFDNETGHMPAGRKRALGDAVVGENLSGSFVSGSPEHRQWVREMNLHAIRRGLTLRLMLPSGAHQSVVVQTGPGGGWRCNGDGTVTRLAANGGAWQ